MSATWTMPKLAVALALPLGLCLVLSTSACTSASAPTPPPASAPKSDKDESSGKKSADSTRPRASSPEASSSEDEDESSDEEDSSKKSKDEDSGSSSYACAGPGVKHLDAEQKKDAKKCFDKAKVYDPFSGDSGECTGSYVAKVDCSESGLKKILSDKQKEQFNESISGSYSGWDILNCVDCPEGNTSKACKSSDGKQQTGTRVNFIKSESSQIRGKSMVLPPRPNSKSKSDPKCKSVDFGDEESSSSSDDEETTSDEE